MEDIEKEEFDKQEFEEREYQYAEFCPACGQKIMFKSAVELTTEDQLRHEALMRCRCKEGSKIRAECRGIREGCNFIDAIVLADSDEDINSFMKKAVPLLVRSQIDSLTISVGDTKLTMKSKEGYRVSIKRVDQEIKELG